MALTIGLMWFDNSDKSLTAKVVDAAARYRNKFGVVPNCCHINPADLDGLKELGVIKLIPDPGVLPGHLWIGNEERESEGHFTLP
jgi:hypothetical protein